jgi:hypothetical protein
MLATHTAIQGDNSASLSKMSISFLTGGAPCKKQASLDVGGNSINPRSHPHEQSVGTSFTKRKSQPCVRRDRVAQWVASQALSSVTDTESECGSLKHSYVWYNYDHTLETRRGGLGALVHPRANIIFAGQHGFDTDRVTLAGMKIARSKAPAISTIKRHRPSQSAYSLEEKLFIMHRRILKDMQWGDIWKDFEAIFGVQPSNRTVIQMRRTYYRTRFAWGMDYVTRSGSEVSPKDIAIVRTKMSRYTTDGLSFLRADSCGERC